MNKIFFFFLITLSGAPVWPQSSKPAFIRQIKIVRENVFSQTSEMPFYSRWANAAHIVTRERVIRRDLLFREGDILQPDLLEESERKLRRLPFLGKAKVSFQPVSADSVDVVVTTQDQWSTMLQPLLESGGGRTEIGVTAQEFNLLGAGKLFLAEAFNQPEGTTLLFSYDDPQLIGSRWTLSGNLIAGPIQEAITINLTRPFFASDTKWAWNGFYSNIDFTQREFSNGQESNAFTIKSQNAQFSLSRAFGRRFQKKKVQFSYRFQNRDFRRIQGRTSALSQEDQLIHALTLTVSRENLNFRKERKVDRFLKTEDIVLGSHSAIAFGRTGLPFPVGIKRFELTISQRQAYAIAQKQYLILNGSYQSLFDQDQILSFQLRYYNKHFPHQTLALNVAANYSWNLEQGKQFLLGGDNGLRGYSARQFAGDRRFLLNFEDRFFSNIEILTVALGGVMFIDAGQIWNEGQSFSMHDINVSAGFGLRMGFTKSPRSRVGRLDLAIPINNTGGFGLYIGVDQIFSID